eukprot:16229-Rhodomonas_salina.1
MAELRKRGEKDAAVSVLRRVWVMSEGWRGTRGGGTEEAGERGRRRGRGTERGELTEWKAGEDAVRREEGGGGCFGSTGQEWREQRGACTELALPSSDFELETEAGTWARDRRPGSRGRSDITWAEPRMTDPISQPDLIWAEAR